MSTEIENARHNPVKESTAAARPQILTADFIRQQYADVRDSVARAKAAHPQAVFDYESEEGEKAARSHIAKLRKLKAAIENRRKEAKAESLEYGRRVDAEAAALTGEVLPMIEAHEAPLREKAAREEKRVAGLKARVDSIRDLGILTYGMVADDIAKRINQLTEIRVGPDWQEYEAAADLLKRNTLDKLRAEYESARSAEREAREAREALAAAAAAAAAPPPFPGAEEGLSGAGMSLPAGGRPGAPPPPGPGPLPAVSGPFGGPAAPGAAPPGPGAAPAAPEGWDAPLRRGGEEPPAAPAWLLVEALDVLQAAFYESGWCWKAALLAKYESLMACAGRKE